MASHCPGATWERRSPEALGFDPDRLDEAIAFALDTESSVEQDLAGHRLYRDEEGEYGELVGPMPDRRGDPNGLIVRDGYVAAEWGDTADVQLAFSVTKSFLSTLAGLAVDRGLIDDVDDPVADTVDDGGFDSSHNASITWHHLLQGTSEWEGTLFGKPDAIDRNRPVGVAADAVGERGTRELREPGTHWEYNDVRINRLALALLRVWERPLPDVLRDEVLAPIGASDAWEWHGYRNSYVDVGGERVQSVSGGGHWGGGMWMHSRDLARFGHLYCNRGAWDGRRVLPAGWVDEATTPCAIKPAYGYLWWLNTDRRLWPSAPAESFAALGYGGNVVWVDPTRDVVAVVRWLESGDYEGETRPNQDGFLARLVAAVEG